MPKRDMQATYVRLPREMHAAVIKDAAENERTMAQTVRLAIRQYLGLKP